MFVCVCVYVDVGWFVEFGAWGAFVCVCMHVSYGYSYGYGERVCSHIHGTNACRYVTLSEHNRGHMEQTHTHTYTMAYINTYTNDTHVH